MGFKIDVLLEVSSGIKKIRVHTRYRESENERRKFQNYSKHN